MRSRVQTTRSRFAILLTALVTAMMLMIAIPPPASATVTTTPAGLEPGDQYRLVFATDAYISGNQSLGTYDSFASTQANLAPELAALGTSWQALVSTGPTRVDARDHTGTNPNVSAGVPIYRLDGQLVAPDNAGLWDSTIDNSISLTQSGNISVSPLLFGRTDRVWTGSQGDGTWSETRALGNFGSCCKRVAGSSLTAGWWNTGNITSGQPLPIFVMSGVLTVPILPADQQIDNLVAEVAGLVDSGELTAEQALELELKLKAALEKLDKSQADKAIKKLNDFIKLIDQYLAAEPPQIEPGVAQDLKDAAQAAIDSINAA